MSYICIAHDEADIFLTNIVDLKVNKIKLYEQICKLYLLDLCSEK